MDNYQNHWRLASMAFNPPLNSLTQKKKSKNKKKDGLHPVLSAWGVQFSCVSSSLELAAGPFEWYGLRRGLPGYGRGGLREPEWWRDDGSDHQSRLTHPAPMKGARWGRMASGMYPVSVRDRSLLCACAPWSSLGRSVLRGEG